MQKIIPNLWFSSEAEEAAAFYTSIFKNSSIGEVRRYGKEGFEIHGQKEGTAMTVSFTLEGQDFLALNGGPVFKFNEAISFIVNCEYQEEVDYFWEKLGEGGDPASQQCGWLKDRFGLSWQIVPKQLSELMADPDPKVSGAVMNAMLKMKKLDIAALEQAAAEARG
jgi:predicted 3-demethylubiquinone-9 3-methyltransferase (glyoxalase superfamily)